MQPKQSEKQQQEGSFTASLSRESGIGEDNV